MAGPNTPDPALADAAAAFEKQLLALDEALAAQFFDASSSDDTIAARASGAGDLVSLTISAELLTPAAGPGLSAALISVLNAVLAKWQAKARADLASLAAGFSLPGFPADPRVLPDIPAFGEAVSIFRRQMDALEAAAATAPPYVGRAADGKVEVAVNGLLDVTAMTLDPSLFSSADAPATASFIQQAVNVALRTARHDDACQETDATAATVARGARTISVSIPSAFTPEAVALGSVGALTIGSNAEIIKTPSGFATITNTSSSGTTLGGKTKVGDIWSQGRVTLGANTRVNGTIRSPVAVVKPSSATVTGGIIQEPVTAALTSWQVGFPLTSGGNVVLGSGQHVHLNPGRFGSVTLGPSSELFLRTGTYYFDSLAVVSGARVHLDMSAGAINVYVLNQVVWSGSAIRDAGEEANLLLGHFGSSYMAFSTPLPGTLVAPNAEIALGSLASPSEYVGAIFSKKITLGSAKFRHVAYKEWALLTA